MATTLWILSLSLSLSLVFLSVSADTHSKSPPFLRCSQKVVLMLISRLSPNVVPVCLRIDDLELLHCRILLIASLNLRKFCLKRNGRSSKLRSDSPTDKMACDVILFKIGGICAVFLVIIQSGQHALQNLPSKQEILKASFVLVVLVTGNVVINWGGSNPLNTCQLRDPGSGQIESGIAKAEVWTSGALSLGLHLAYVSWGWQSRFGSNLICLKECNGRLSGVIRVA
ncbi:hypothetical protein CK203_003640 [Vitis vinifera]|uniref:Transmembrane protein n=1 Tax=Vitis vinifera TaxID=29760 RepID=A0A438K7Z1_VITVI|nr:hypothetical protein CK203_003640 [Vitis vinifera]